MKETIFEAHTHFDCERTAEVPSFQTLHRHGNEPLKHTHPLTHSGVVEDRTHNPGGECVEELYGTLDLGRDLPFVRLMGGLAKDTMKLI